METSEVGPSASDRSSGSTRRLNIAAATIAIADLGVLAWGALATVNPSVLTAGFETYTAVSWPSFVAGNASAAGFIVIGFRLVGALNVALGLVLLAIALTALRHGERWAWWILLVGNTLAIGSPMVYDQLVGFIGPFEVLEYVALFAVYAALAATVRKHRRIDRSAVSERQFGWGRP